MPAPSPADDPSLTLAEVYRAHAGFVWRVVRRLGVAESAQEDVVQIKTSAGKVTGRAEKIGALEFDDARPAEPALPFAKGLPLKAAE